MVDQVTPELLIEAYCMGIFPMGDARGRIEWYSPDPRTVLEPANYHVPHNLKKVIRRGKFETRINTCFREVLDACADRRRTWITRPIKALYLSLHERGFAHSVESWHEGQLAGGLYGVAIGGAFFGESMFHRVSDASKVALVALLDRLATRGFELCDTQWNTDHLRWFGAVDLPRTEYLRRLHHAIQLPVTFV